MNKMRGKWGHWMYFVDEEEVCARENIAVVTPGETLEDDE